MVEKEIGDEETAGRLYITSSERREAGREHQLTSWLSASFLFEFEAESEGFRTRDDGDRVRQHTADATLQLGVIASPWENVKAEVVLELDTETEQPIADEAFVRFELDDWELEAGRMYTPFGVYISHFATGPLLEAGETRADSVVFSYDPSDRLDLFFSLPGRGAQSRRELQFLGLGAGGGNLVVGYDLGGVELSV